MLKSSGAMSLATFISRILGMLREMVYATFMGDTWVAGAFQLAFTIPNLFRRLLGEGALTAAFIPIFKDKEKNAGEQEMWRAANAVISGLVLATSAIVIVVLLGLTVTLQIGHFETDTRLMLELLRVMFPYMILVCLAAVLMAMLNARGHFFIPALGATLLNLVMIASVTWLAPRFGVNLETQIFALAVGVLVAGFAQAGFQMPVLWRDGFRFKWETPWQNETVRTVITRMIPGTIGVAAFQINVLVTQGIAFGLDPMINASFGYAIRLMELPQGMFGIALATFMLPTLSGFAAEKKFKDFSQTVNKGMEHLLFVNLPASILLVLLAEPIIRMIFEHGKFGPDSTQRATLALAFLAPGLLAYSMVNILARAFFALGDTTTPMKISIFCLVTNLLLTLAFVFPMQQAGLGLANTLTSWINVWLLHRALKKKLQALDLSEFHRSVAPTALAAFVACASAYGVWWWWSGRFGHGNTWLRIGEVFAPLLTSIAVYWGVAWPLKISSAHEMLGMLKRRRQG
jgi:putative peptidoglycan lipid II flippase